MIEIEFYKKWFISAMNGTRETGNNQIKIKKDGVRVLMANLPIRTN